MSEGPSKLNFFFMRITESIANSQTSVKIGFNILTINVHQYSSSLVKCVSRKYGYPQSIYGCDKCVPVTILSCEVNALV